MKSIKVTLLFISLFISVSIVAFGQDDSAEVSILAKDTIRTSSLVFVSDAFNNDFALFQEMCSKHSNYELKEWAKDLNKHFTTDENGAIHLEYVMMANRSFDIENIKTYAIGWFNYAFSNANAITAITDNSIAASGKLINIAQKNVNAIFYAKTIKVNADIDIVVKFKDNRIKIDTYIRHYQYVSGDSMMQSKNDLIICGSVFPIVKDGNDEQVFACAFINSLDNSFNKIESFIKYMNQPINEGNLDEDW